MANSSNNGINAELFCSLFGHNFVLKPDFISLKDIHVCKTCKEEFILEDIDAFSGLPKTTEYISLFRLFLQHTRLSKNHLIS
jgi:hypothetical protein